MNECEHIRKVLNKNDMGKVPSKIAEADVWKNLEYEYKKSKP